MITIGQSAPITVPVHVRLPKSAEPGKSAKQTFTTLTGYVMLRLPTEDELEAITFAVARDNDGVTRRIVALEKQRDEETGELGKRRIEAEIAAANKDMKSFQVEQLKAVVVGLPDDSGFQDGDGSAAWSPDLLERMCQHRHIRAGLWDAFMLALNGPSKDGG